MKKRILRVMLENKSFYLSAILLVTIVTVVCIAFISGGKSAKQSVNDFKRDCLVEDAQFITAKPIDNLEQFEKDNNVILEEMNSKDVSSDNKLWVRVFEPNQRINKYQVIKGKDLSQDGDVLLNSFYAQKNKISIGQKLMLDGKEFTVTGTFTRPDYLYLLKNLSDLMPKADTFTTAVVSQKAYSRLGGTSSSYYSIILKDTDSLAFRKKFSEELNIINWVDKDDNPRISTINSDVDAFVMIGYIAPIFALIVACAFLAVVLGRLLKRDFAQAGTLYALGIRKHELVMHYLSYPVILSIIGAIFGTIIGFLLTGPMDVFVKEQYAAPVIVPVIDPKTVAIAVTMPIIFMIITSLFVILKALNLPPLVLMRGGVEKVRIGYLERFIKPTFMKFESRFKLKEQLRNIPRTLLVIIGVAFSSALMLFGFIISDSINTAVKNPLEVYNYNYAYTLRMPVSEVPEGTEGFVRGLFEPANSSNSGEGFTIWGIDPNSKMVNLIDDKDNKLDYSKAIISKPLMNKLKINVGDTIKIRNKLTLKEYDLLIQDCADINMGQCVFMPIDRYLDMTGSKQKYYSGVFSMKKQDIDEKNIVTLNKRDELLEGVETMIKPIKGLLYLLSILSFIIGLLILYVVISMLIEENRSNISLFKVLGYHRKEISSLIINSTNILVLIGFALSIPLIVRLSQMLLNAITETMSFYFYATLKPLSILYGFVLIMATFIISKAISKRKLNNVSMVDSLKARE